MSSTVPSALILAASMLLVAAFLLASKSPPSNSSSTGVISRRTTTTTTTPSTLPPFDGRPRVLLSTGCSGSSITVTTAKDIVSAHYNRTVYQSHHGYELYKPQKNPMYSQAKQLLHHDASSEEILEKALELLYQDAKQKNQILVTKLHPSQVHLHRYLKTQLQARFSTEIRINPIDQSICQVRDCFQTSRHSYPVFAINGSETNLCFERRKLPQIPILAYMDPATWPRMVEELHHQSNKCKQQYETEFAPYQAQTYEDLFAFTQTDSETVFQKSLEAWSRLVEPWIEGSVDWNIVAKVLRSKQNTRSQSPKHSELIYNSNESIAMLWEHAPTLTKEYLRE